MQKTSAQQILAESIRFLITEVHTSDLDCVHKRKLEQVVVHNSDNVRIRIHSHAGQTIDPTHELAVAAGVVRSPSPALRRKEVTAAEFRANVPSRRNSHRKSRRTEIAVTAAAVWVFR